LISITGIDFGSDSCPTDDLTITIYNYVYDISNGTDTESLKMEEFKQIIQAVTPKNIQPLSLVQTGDLIGEVQSITLNISLPND